MSGYYQPAPEPAFRLMVQWICHRCGWNYLVATTPQCLNPACQHKFQRTSERNCDRCRVEQHWVPVDTTPPSQTS